MIIDDHIGIPTVHEDRLAAYKPVEEGGVPDLDSEAFQRMNDGYAEYGAPP